eukprot:CAMPEP_0170518166 /NCGR_PEP_ID=MMETSP0209-20121228/3920_1 /TAXON_ID=665100 ORGANISM="Litonotus pictus, Strain P1" /NCGR_SAMPLE_ID=MMETSP0209 /ASSEMBLY_ACC=CAM_ASM_000301 /LENGTH=120 /DNA_ID=CAMNT_0010803619 /DNA_START=156 /DNA_END=518 /DNA_ORIENTATION=+
MALVKGKYKLMNQNCNYQVDCQQMVSSSNNSLNIIQLEYLCNVDSCNIEVIERVTNSGNTETSEMRNESRMVNDFRFLISKLEDNKIILNFEEATQHDLFFDFQSDQKWFYHRDENDLTS